MYNDVLVGLIAVVAMVLVVFGGAFMVGDFRHFENIKSDCIKYGYVQNKTVRITCQVNK